MTKMNYFRDVFSRFYAVQFSILILALFCINSANGQCPQSLGCNDNIQISLDLDCYAVITPDLILEDEMDNCPYMITLLDLNDQIIATTLIDPVTMEPIYPSIDGSFVGQVWKASISVTDNFGITNSCWGYFTVEDKLPPTITCIDDITVECSEDLSDLYSSQSTVTYCSEVDPVDMDMDLNTQTICLTTDDTSHPWEIIDNVLIAGTVTGSGSGLLLPSTGSGSFDNGLDNYQFSIHPVTGQIYGSELAGVQATEENLPPKIFMTVSSSYDLSEGICVNVNTTSFFNYQTIDNCDPSTEVIVTRDEIEDLQCDESSDVTARRDITYFTKDKAGLSAEPCDFSIFFERKSLLDLEFPDNISFDCDDDIIFDDEGELDLNPSVTGYPLLDGVPLMDHNNLCRINVTFEDDTFNLCGSNTLKILRRWTALDWCGGQYSQAYQSIKVQDVEAPEIICPDGWIEFKADGDCTADVVFKPLDSSDTTGVEFLMECSEFNIVVQYLDGNNDYQNAVNIGNNMFQIFDLPFGVHTIRYLFTDDCGNSKECTFEVGVIDDAAPIPVCDQFTAVVLADNGWARAYTETFDDGSYDDCGGPITFQVRRPDLHCAPYDTIFDKFGQIEALSDTLFSDFVEFCCEDAGQTVDVILKVTDAGGRYNTCRVKVEVQDKTPFTIISCPERVWNLDCTQDIDTAFLGVPVIEDNCAYASLDFEDVGDINMSCGQGQIIRSWFVEVNSVVQELVSCRQTINVTNQNVLSYDDFDWPPSERTDATCFNYFTDLGDTVRIDGVPVTELDLCAQLAYSYKDKVFRNVEGFCLKIIRTWTVIDWCTYDPNNNPNQGIWTDSQIIKVSNAEGPELSNCSQDTLIQILGNTCSATVFIEAPSAYDQCFDEAIPPNRVRYELVDTGADTLVQLGLGNLLPIELQRGSYRITWSVESGCSVTSTCSSSITIVDAKAPSPYCKSGITTVLMPPGVNNEDPMVEIWASDFDLNSTDNCSENLTFSFDPDVFVPNMGFTCDELGLQGLDVWVIDEDGNKDFCHTAIMIQANGDICPPDTSDMGMAVGGDILTLDSGTLEDVEVSLENMTAYNMDYKMTDESGHFEFIGLHGNADYRVRAKKDNDHLNGVSTLDLIMIQRHVLGIEALDSPYKLMAADINSSEDISAVDLIELRKLILGIYSELPDNDSWRFVDTDQVFADDLNPWPFKENIDLNNISSPMMDNDFVAVKIGDVNGSIQLDNISNNQIESRSEVEAELSYDILEIRPNAEYLVPFYISNMDELLGLQVDLEYNSSDYQIVGIEAGKLDLTEVNFISESDNLRISWHTSDPVILSDEEAAFYLTVKSNQRLNVGTFAVNNTFLKSEAYDSDYNVYQLILNEQNLDVNNRLHQNIPNPFSASTTIEFDLAWDMEVTINIVDMRGQLIRSYTGWYNKGRNAITVESNDLNGNGIYYFNLESDAFSATKKMILIE